MAEFKVQSARGTTATVRTATPVDVKIQTATPVQVLISGSLRGPTGRFTLRGTYSNAIAYNRDDLVDYGGSSYAKKSTSAAGTIPTNTTYWQLIATGYDITVGTTAPSNPTENSLWVDTSP